MNVKTSKSIPYTAKNGGTTNCVRGNGALKVCNRSAPCFPGASPQAIIVECLWHKTVIHATGQVTGQVAAQVLEMCREARAAREIQGALGLKHRETFLNNYLKPLLRSGWIEMTIPDKPNSSNQKYRLTAKGEAMRNELVEKLG